MNSPELPPPVPHATVHGVGTKPQSNQATDREQTVPTKRNPIGWAVSILAAVGVLLTLSLGTWQLRRAAQKEALTQHIYQQNTLPALTNTAQAATLNIADGTVPVASLVQRNVLLQGTWLSQYTVYLDNRYMGGRVGFYVVTPLQLEGGNKVVWVQRGWVARSAQDRARLPPVSTAAGIVTVQGKVVDSISKVYALGDDAVAQASTLAAAGASRIWQNLPKIVLDAPMQWLPWAVLQTHSAPAALAQAPLAAAPSAPPLPSPGPDGLLREWPAPDAGVSKHYGYAFQWLALCGLIIGLYVWFYLIAPRRKQV